MVFDVLNGSRPCQAKTSERQWELRVSSSRGGKKEQETQQNTEICCDMFDVCMRSLNPSRNFL